MIKIGNLAVVSINPVECPELGKPDKDNPNKIVNPIFDNVVLQDAGDVKADKPRVTVAITHAPKGSFTQGRLIEVAFSEAEPPAETKAPEAPAQTEGKPEEDQNQTGGEAASPEPQPKAPQA